MPYKIQKGDGGYFVVNSETGQRKNKKAMTHEAALKYLRALYANVPDASK